jgi:hypothetical protein
MNTNDLETAIQALTHALRQTQQLNHKARADLGLLQKEIDRALDLRTGGPLRDRLEELAVRFENDHPAAGNVLRQAIDALAKAGM